MEFGLLRTMVPGRRDLHGGAGCGGGVETCQGRGGLGRGSPASEWSGFQDLAKHLSRAPELNTGGGGTAPQDRALSH